jgi:hypothetical protein
MSEEPQSAKKDEQPAPKPEKPVWPQGKLLKESSEKPFRTVQKVLDEINEVLRKK